jgi:hypothetical protein
MEKIVKIQDKCKQHETLLEKGNKTFQGEKVILNE